MACNVVLYIPPLKWVYLTDGGTAPSLTIVADLCNEGIVIFDGTTGIKLRITLNLCCVVLCCVVLCLYVYLDLFSEIFVECAGLFGVHYVSELQGRDRQREREREREKERSVV